MPERMRKPLEDLKIVQTASWVPDQVIDNDDLSRIMDTSDDWIQSRTGIKRRQMGIVKAVAKVLDKKVCSAELVFVVADRQAKI